MNAALRRQLQTAFRNCNLHDITVRLNALQDALQTAADSEAARFAALSEEEQDSDVGQNLEQAIDTLQNLTETIEYALEYLDGLSEEDLP